MPLNDLIPIINQLQEAFAPLGIPPIDLPQVLPKDFLCVFVHQGMSERLAIFCLA